MRKGTRKGAFRVSVVRDARFELATPTVPTPGQLRKEIQLRRFSHSAAYASRVFSPIKCFNRVYPLRFLIIWAQMRRTHCPRRDHDDVDLVKRVVRVSLETLEIVGTLPPLHEKPQPADWPIAWKASE